MQCSAFTNWLDERISAWDAECPLDVYDAGEKAGYIQACRDAGAKYEQQLRESGMKTGIKPCRCGSGTILLKEYARGETKIQCLVCGHSIRKRATRIEAIEAWSRRSGDA